MASLFLFFSTNEGEGGSGEGIVGCKLQVLFLSLSFCIPINIVFTFLLMFFFSNFSLVSFHISFTVSFRAYASTHRLTGARPLQREISLFSDFQPVHRGNEVQTVGTRYQESSGRSGS